MGTYAVTALDGVAYGMLLFCVGAGLALVFGVADVLNLAHGALYLAGAYLAYLCGGHSLLTLAAALAAGLLLGAGAGTGLAVVLRPLAGAGHLDQALVTLGLAYLAADGYTTGFGASPLPAGPPTLLAGHVTMGGHGYPVYRLVFIALAAASAAGLHLVIRHSRAGIWLRATVSDPAMAAATGIPTTRVRIGVLAVGSALAVGGGVLGAPLVGPAPGVDTTVLLLSLVIVVLGGGRHVLATLGAALLVGQVQAIGVLLAPALAPFALFAALLVVLVGRGRRNGLSRVRTV